MAHDSASRRTRWRAALRAAGRSSHTLESYRRAVEGLKAWRGDPDLTTVRPRSTRAAKAADPPRIGEEVAHAKPCPGGPPARA